MYSENGCAYPVTSCTRRATLHIVGRCEYLNCLPLRKFLDFATSCSHYEEIVLEFGECLSVDSTALGLMARAAITLRPAKGRRLILANLNEGPMNAATQLGLAHICTIASLPEAKRTDFKVEAQETVRAGRVDHATIRDAHEALVEIEPANHALFADVLSFITTSRSGAFSHA